MSEPILAGRTVVITRPTSQAGRLRELLIEAGATVIEAPSIRFVETESLEEWGQVIDRRTTYTHVLFTSRVAVDFFAALCDRSGVDVAQWSNGARVGALGARTARKLEEIGLAASFVGSGRGASAFAHELVASAGLGPGCRALLPQSDIARPELRDLLVEAGVGIDAIAIYSTRGEDPRNARALLEHIDRGGKLDAVTFASPSAVRGFLEICGYRGREVLESNAVRIVTIGATTSGALTDAGLRIDGEALVAGPEGLVEAVAKAC